MKKNIVFNLNLFKEKFKSKIDIKSQSFLEKTYLNFTSFQYISDYIKNNKIDTGDFLFGFDNSILLFENGFFSRNTKKLYPFKELSKCIFKEKGKLIKSKRFVLKLRHSEFELDVLPYTSKLDEKTLKELLYYVNLDEEKIIDEKQKIKDNKNRLKEDKLISQKNFGSINKIWKEIKIDILKHKENINLIDKEEDRINTNRKIIIDTRKSILIESTLKGLPKQGVGSVEFYNGLNQKRKLYDNNQFSNITRFLTHVENTENEYRNLYIKSHKLYINSPNDQCYELLLTTLSSLNIYYELSKVLINEIDKDLVNFTKVYNELEDKGYFLNEIEKFQIKNLINISNSLLNINNNINNLSNNLLKGFRMIEDSLRSIDSSIQDVYIETSTVVDKLNDIDMTLLDM